MGSCFSVSSSSSSSSSWETIDPSFAASKKSSSSSDSDSSQSLTEEEIKIYKKLQDILYFMRTADSQNALERLQILKAAQVPEDLVSHYVSSSLDDAASTSYSTGITSSEFIAFATSTSIPPDTRFQFIPLFLQACKMFRDANLTQNSSYDVCRTGLLKLLQERTSYSTSPGVNSYDLVPFLAELATEIRPRLSWISSHSCVLGRSYLKEFSAFLVIIRNEIMDKYIASSGPMEVPQLNEGQVGEEEICRLSVCHSDEEVMICIHRIFIYLMSEVEDCLMKMKLDYDEASHYFGILCDANSISKFYRGYEEMFWEMIRRRHGLLMFLLAAYAIKHQELKWILECTKKFEERRGAAMLFLPVITPVTGNKKVRIDRSDLLASSYRNIMRADPEILCTYFLQFKNEEAFGVGVLREWLILVCQEIFNPVKNLFVACSSHRRRFIPNAEAEVNPIYFNFAGRVIALALMHKVQVDVALDRVFYLQLAGEDISLEDIRDADPRLYTSCKQILEMDAEIVDQDVLGLTFVREIEGKVIELCPGGRNIVVSSENRKAYVDSLIKHTFVKSIRKQVAHFAQGFDDVNRHEIHKAFFRCLYLEDLDMMLLGSGSEISVDDWRSHTVCVGFKKTDPQISWFWKIVRNMSNEQKIALLYFWTSIRHLPFNGFGDFRHDELKIKKTFQSRDFLPSSHTCFYELLFPAYGSFGEMRERLNFITQEYVASSFGMA